jgi:dephospho-CoA kinase
VVFDVPLLYETHAEQQCDVVLVVSASAEQQRQRVLARPGMTVEKLAAMLARQVCGRVGGAPLCAVCRRRVQEAQHSAC